jgi:hypothetical protein
VVRLSTRSNTMQPSQRTIRVSHHILRDTTRPIRHTPAYANHTAQHYPLCRAHTPQPPHRLDWQRTPAARTSTHTTNKQRHIPSPRRPLQRPLPAQMRVTPTRQVARIAADALANVHPTSGPSLDRTAGWMNAPVAHAVATEPRRARLTSDQQAQLLQHAATQGCARSARQPRGVARHWAWSCRSVERRLFLGWGFAQGTRVRGGACGRCGGSAVDNRGLREALSAGGAAWACGWCLWSESGCGLIGRASASEAHAGKSRRRAWSRVSYEVAAVRGGGR